MNQMLTADDLWPLVLKLSHDEQVRLAKLIFQAAGHGNNADAAVFSKEPPEEASSAIENGPVDEETRRPAVVSPIQASAVYRFEGIFIDGYIDEDSEGTKDEQEGNTIERGTLREERGRRALRLEGKSQRMDCIFELVAHEEDANGGIFKGTWQLGIDDAPEAIELRLYGDPAGEFALVGDYLCEGDRYCWTMELFPREERDDEPR